VKYGFLGWVSIAHGCRAQPFVSGKLVRLVTVFVSSIKAPRASRGSCALSINPWADERRLEAAETHGTHVYQVILYVPKEGRNSTWGCSDKQVHEMAGTSAGVVVSKSSPATRILKSSVFWEITPRRQLKVDRYFGGTCRLHLQSRRIQNKQIPWP
jgi:hypothetical protein